MMGVTVKINCYHIPSRTDRIRTVYFTDKDAAIRTIGTWTRGEFRYSILGIKSGAPTGYIGSGGQIIPE